MVLTETLWPAKPKIFSAWGLAKKFALSLTDAKKGSREEIQFDTRKDGGRERNKSKREGRKEKRNNKEEKK